MKKGERAPWKNNPQRIRSKWKEESGVLLGLKTSFR